MNCPSRPPAACVLVAILIGILCNRAAAPSLLDRSFDPGTGADGIVHALLVLPDGNVLLGGAFMSFDGTPRRGIVRLLPDGSIDKDFDPEGGVGGLARTAERAPRVHALAQQTDGKILIGGEFTSFGGVRRLNLARLHPDGRLDKSFAAEISDSRGANYSDGRASFSAVYALKIQPDAKVLVGGEFNRVNDSDSAGLIRLNQDGSIDPTFDATESLIDSDIVQSIAVSDGGSIVLGGSFRNLLFPEWHLGIREPPLRRLTQDGQRDAEFEMSLDHGFSARTVLILPDGEIIAAGDFDLNPYDSAPQRAEILQMRADGSVVRRSLFGFEGSVFTVHGLPGGRLMVGGDFQSVFGKPRSRLARLLPDGSLDQCFAWNLNVDGVLSREHFLGADGRSIPATTSVQAVQTSTDGSGVFIAGNFARIDGIPRAGIARIGLKQDCDGGTIGFSTSEFHVRQDAGVAQILIERSASNNQDASVLFETHDASAQAGLDYVSVSETVRFAPGELSRTVEVPVRFYSREPADRIVELSLGNIEGGATLGRSSSASLRISYATGLETLLVEDPDFEAELPEGAIPTILSQRDGRLLVMTCSIPSSLTYLSALYRLNLDGTRDPTFNLGFTPEGCIHGISNLDDGRLILWGGYSLADGSPFVWLRRVHIDGSLDESFIPARFEAVPDSDEPGALQRLNFTSVNVLTGNRLLVAGRFRATDGVNDRSGLVRLSADGSLDATFEADLPGGTSPTVVSVQPDGKPILRYFQGDSLNRTRVVVRLNDDGSRDRGFQVDFPDAQFPLPVLSQSNGQLVFGGSTSPDSEVADHLLIRINHDGSRDLSFQGPTFRNSRRSSGRIRSAFVEHAVELEDSSLLLDGSFDWVDGLPRNAFVRLFPNGPMDASFRAQVPTILENGAQYWPSESQIVWTDEKTVVARITYRSIATADIPYFTRLKAFRFVTREAVPTFQFAAAGTNGVIEASSRAIATIFRTGSSLAATSVRYHTVSGSAAEDEDFEPQAGVLEFAPGERRKDIHVPVVNDDRVEPKETFQVVLSEPSFPATVAGPTAIDVEIVDDDHDIEFESTQVRVDELRGVVVLRVRRSGVPTDSVTVDFTTRDSTAIGGQDYQPYHGALYFDYRFDTVASIYIDVPDDPIAEGDETFEVVLSNPAGGASLGANSIARVTIQDNDAPDRPGRGVNGTVLALASQGDGRVMVGGDFTTVNGVARKSLARVHTDLTLDETFDAHLDVGAEIRKIVVQTNGQVIVTGTFTNIQGVVRTRIARFESDGALDEAFAPTFLPSEPVYSGFTRVVESVALQPDGKLLVGGTFTNVNGITRTRIARLNEDGSLDHSFTHGIFIGQPQWWPLGVNDILVLPDGKIVIGGAGNTHRDPIQNTVLRLEPNGDLDPSFVASLSRKWVWDDKLLPLYVHSITRLHNGQIVVVPSPGWVQSRFGPPLVRLNRDGTEDSDFSWNVQGIGYEPLFLTNPAHCVIEGPDGAIWVGGQGIALRLNPDGSLAEFNPLGLSTASIPRIQEYTSVPFGLVRTLRMDDPEIRALALKPDGRIVVGGNFITTGEPRFFSLAEIYPDGTPYGQMRLDSPRILSDGRIGLTLIAPTDKEITLERSLNLDQWQPLLMTIPSTNRFEVTDPDPPGSAPRFYRLRRERP